MKTLGCVVSVIHLVLLLDTTSLSSAQQSCNEGGLLSWPGQSFGDNGGGRIPEDSQVILPRYRLTCNGNVTEWAVDLSAGGVYRVALQVWRQSSSCYSLVGSNILSTSISGGSLVTLTPTSQITVQPSDVVGFSVIDAPSSNDQGVNLHTDSDARMILETSATRTCLRSTTSTLAPVISISVLEATSTTIVVPTSTPHPLLPSTTTMMTFEISSTQDQMISTPNPQTTSTMLSSSPSPTPPATMTISPKSVSTSSVSSTPLSSSTSTTNINMESTSIAMTSGGALTNTETSGETPTSLTLPTVSTPQEASSVATPIVIVLVLLCLVAIVTVIVVAAVIGVRRLKRSGKGNLSLSNPNYDDVHMGTRLNKLSNKDQELAAEYDLLNSGSHEYAYIETSPSKRQPSVHTESSGIYSYTGPTHDITIPAKNSKARSNTFDNHDYDELDFDDDDGDSGSNYRVNTLKMSYSPVKESELELVYGTPVDSVDPAYMANAGVFDFAGTFVPTGSQRKELVDGHYDIGDTQVYNKTSFFVKDHDYWTPAVTTSALYEQLAEKKYREIPRPQIRTEKQIGSGQFGEVFKSVWSVSGAELDVAVKMLRASSSEEDKVKFLQEAAIMGQFMHKNIVKLYGVVTVGEPVMICLEMLKTGDLRKYLNSIERSSDVLQHRFLKFARDIAAGMSYLSSKSFIHRDLAARNILLNDWLTCKIGDFGMARDLMDDTYYTGKGGKIPVKWTAPEALFFKKYSTDSDVWSYGMVLFEIWSVGRKPLSEFSVREVLRKIQDGFCQPPPPGCPRPLYELMVDCWCPEHVNRPKFNEICTYLKQPPTHLLSLDLLDPDLSPKANMLGEELEHSKQLYLDLQHKYCEVDLDTCM